MNKCFWQIVMLFCAMYSGITLSNETFRLTDFYSGESPVRLLGLSEEEALSIPLSSIHDVQSATIHLEIASSVALLERRSVLNVRFNNATIAQIPYLPNQPYISQDVTIPTSLWREGFNDLTFQVSQHSVGFCSDGNAPELWTEVDLYRSFLTIDTQDNIENLTIKHLSGLFSAGIGGQREVVLATINDSNERTQSALVEQVLPLVAQSLALRNDYQPLTITTTGISSPELPTLPLGFEWTDNTQARYMKSRFYIEQLSSKNLHVVVATKAELTPYVTDSILDEIQGAYIGIETQPEIVIGDQLIVPEARRLIISGTSVAEVKLAALSLGTLNDELNPDVAINVLAQTALTTQDYINAHVLQPNQQYTFGETGSPSSEFRGSGEFIKTVNLKLPADFYTPESATVEILLDFAYGAGMGQGSIMNISVNNKVIHGLLLDNPNGQAYDNYRLDIPARYFYAGSNRIEFSISSRSPQSASNCDKVPGSHLVFQLYSSSLIRLPQAGKVAQQPNLALFSDTTFPFLYATPETPATFYYSQPEMLGAALTLAGKSAQVADTINPNMIVKSGIPNTLNPFAMILARPSDLNDALFVEYNTALTNVKKWSYQLQNNLQNSLESGLKEAPGHLMKVEGVTLQASTLGDLGVLIMKENPTSTETGSLMIIAAETTEIMQQRVTDLVSLSLWGQLAGDFFAWSNSDTPDLVMRVSSKFEIGEPVSQWLAFRMWLSNHPMYWIIAILIFLLIGSITSYQALKKRNKDIESSW